MEKRGDIFEINFGSYFYKLLKNLIILRIIKDVFLSKIFLLEYLNDKYKIRYKNLFVENFKRLLIFCSVDVLQEIPIYKFLHKDLNCVVRGAL